MCVRAQGNRTSTPLSPTDMANMPSPVEFTFWLIEEMIPAPAHHPVLLEGSILSLLTRAYTLHLRPPSSSSFMTSRRRQPSPKLGQARQEPCVHSRAHSSSRPTTASLFCLCRRPYRTKPWQPCLSSLCTPNLRSHGSEGMGTSRRKQLQTTSPGSPNSPW